MEVELKISGLKCDNCDYRDDTVKFSEYKSSIDKPCPKCGTNLLTESEYNVCLEMYRKVEESNRVINVIKWLNPSHYSRLIFGDKRKKQTIIKEFPKRKIN